MGADEPSSSAATTLQWGYPGALRRRVLYDVLPQYKQLRLRSQEGAAAPSGHDGGGGGNGGGSTQALAEYSAAVSEVLALAAASGSDCDDEGEAAVLAAEKVVWQLLHSFFVGGGRVAGSMTEDIVWWVHANAAVLCGGFTGDAAVEEAGGWAEPEEHDGYWRSLARCMALGWGGDAARLLGLHTAWLRLQAGAGGGNVEAQVAVVDAMTVLLRRMPRFQLPGGSLAARAAPGSAYDSMPEYLQYRAVWQGQCQKLLGEGELWAAAAAAHAPTADGCRQLLRLLCGDEDALASATGNWLELFAAQLLHIYPALKPQVELRELLNRCLAVKPLPPDAPFLGHLSMILPLAGDLDVQGLLRGCSAIFGDWFLCHAADLLSASGTAQSLLGRPLPAQGGDQREALTLDYAATLMPLSTGWQVAAEYLAWCPVHGADALSAVLARLPPDGGARSTTAALHLCERFSLSSTATGICRAVGVSECCAGRTASAVGWLLHAHDAARAAAVLGGLVDRLEAALLQGQLADDVVAQLRCMQSLLGASSTGPPQQLLASTWLAADGSRGMGGGQVGGTLAYLRRFLQLADAMQALDKAYRTDSQGQGSGDKVTAAGAAVHAALMALLRGGAAPRRAWLPLLFMALPLLDTQPALFSAADVSALITGLQDALVMEGGSVDAMPPAALAVVRLALARSLARTHAIEPAR